MNTHESLTVSSLLEAYTLGKLAPRQLVADILERIEGADNPHIWIYKLSLEELEPYLAALDGKSPESLPLYGIPFAIKDNIDLARIPTTAACRAYSYIPEKSATVVEKLIQSGAIPIGKTNLDQFATGLVGVRSPYGVPKNPLAPDRVPGGSSSGSAVALSEGLVSFSLGTDTAGSGRVPAAFNQLWGIKPSRGRLSTSGVVPACRTLDCVSIFSLSGEDGERILACAEGYDPEDAYSQPTRDSARPIKQTLGIPQPEQLMFFGDAEYITAWERSLEDLRAKGWKMVEIDFAPFLDTARLLYEGPWVSERTATLQQFLQTNSEDFFPATYSIINGGFENTACEAFNATYKLADLKRKSESVWKEVDAIVTPTAGGFPSLADLDADPITPNSKLGYYTNFMNLLDLSALACPAGVSDAGLPFGVTWVAPRDCDRALLSFATKGPESIESDESLSIILLGAHMHGLPLNRQVTELGGSFIAEVETAPIYKMIHLAEPAPHRPGLVRLGDAGSSISGEEWSFPKASLGEFLSKIQQPLGLGEIELSDGRKVHGFLCEAVASESQTDISHFGGWRSFLEERD